MQGRLYDHVLLGMNPAAYLVTLPGRNAKLGTQATGFKAMAHARRRTVVPSGQDAPVKNRDSAHFPA